MKLRSRGYQTNLNFIWTLLTLIFCVQAHATIPILHPNEWQVYFEGFVEFDALSDSTRGFTEIIGNSPVTLPDEVSGALGRTQFSIRNTRLAFDIRPPSINLWKTKGYLEMDFLGLDPTPPSSVGATTMTSEAAFFNNPTLRIRHAYLQAKRGGFQILVGQYWSLLGWQPFYFLPSVDVAPLPGMLYGRTGQIRLMQTLHLSDDSRFQAAIAVMRPPQRDSQYPALEGGLRVTFDKRRSGYIGGSSGEQKTAPASLAISGAIKEYQIPTLSGNLNNVIHFPGTALAVNLMLPVISTSDKKDVSYTLSLLAEFSTGMGYGDEFVGWTGGTAGPLGTASAGTAAALSTTGRPLNLDAGIGDFDVNQKFHLIHLQSFNSYLQYHFGAAAKTWLTVGYSQIFSNNMAFLSNANGTSTSSGAPAYNRDQSVFANLFHDFTSQIRVAAEFANIRTTYVDGVKAHNNRYQLSAFFIF